MTAYDAVLSQYMPPSVLVDGQGRIVHVFGGAGRYLTRLAGRPTADVLRRSEEPLRAAMAAGLESWRQKRKAVDCGDVTVLTEEGQTRLRVRLEPLEHPDAPADWVLICLEPGADTESMHPDAGAQQRRPPTERERERLLFQLSALVRTIGQMTFRHDAVRDHITWSGTELLGVPPESMPANTAGWLERIHPEDVAQVKRALQEARTGKPIFSQRYRLRHADGHYLSFHARGVVYHNADKQLQQIVGVLEDITQRELYQLWLEDQRTRLVRSNEELEHFAHVASHDLREPLRMVSSYISLIEKEYGDKIDESGHEFLHFAIDGAQRMKRLIDDLLTYSRLTSRSHRSKEFELEDAVSVALRNLSVQIDERGGMVTVEPLPRIKGDEVRLVQLFQNLIGNSLKFCGDQKPSIRVSATQEETSWQICVSDNGIGIAPEQFSKIFDVFHRLHGREEYDGTGIGLSICEKIVQNHSGRIWVESEPGKGARFYFTLPYQEQPTAASTETDPPSRQALPTRTTATPAN
ncbi:MAG: ATP-binding protein [Opitutales bacterium]